MKILLDENIDVRFRKCFPDLHDVYTVRYMGWTGIKNGALLQLLAEHCFDCWIVVDKNIPYQQNIENLPFIIIVLDVRRNTLVHLKALMLRLSEMLSCPSAERLIILSE